MTCSPSTARGGDLDSDGECEVCGSEDHDTDDHEDEPQEDDSHVNYGYHGLEYSHGKHHGTADSLDEATHMLLHAQHNEGYFPNMWVHGEHGPTQPSTARGS